MQMTERDMEILRFINEFGFCEIIQIEKKFGLKKSRGYQVMKRLVDAEFVNHQRIFHGTHGIFYLTSQGAECTDFPILKNISRDRYHHQLAIIDTYFKLTEQFPEAEWITERRIKQDKFMKGLGKKGHIPDGILSFPDKEIAIEVELTMKSKKRLQEIFREYIFCFEIREVWYFCAADIINRVRKLAEDRHHIKVHSL